MRHGPVDSDWLIARYKTPDHLIAYLLAVSMRTGANQVLVEYVDLIAYQQGQKEVKSKKEENRRRSTAKDASKF